ncbi:toxin-antitoxin system YwqK family antitoxin [uncultured Flavobacterium sp.]|uniref:toxin-antitoxin system YwqK family antitoxin n=1 Tax=uncultured Flavobacterium sp. TaxID=165435 RepID=UPI0025FEB949|nr:toxin-antitoxin system YwqK family antitoxin [uncultured Flavobacterium sp.]
MKKSFLSFIIAMLIPFAAFAQEINKMDTGGKRHGVWKGIYEESKRPRYEGTFEHGKETGTFRFFEDNKASTIMATRVFAADGSCYTTFFDETGSKLSEGREVNRLNEGEWKYYHPGGKAIMSSERFIKGKLTGIRKVFFPNGNINEETTFVNGLREGIYKKYTEKGILLEDSNYKNDQMHGPATYRDGQGKIVMTGQYTNGKKTGKWKFYENDKVVKEQNLSKRGATLSPKVKTEGRRPTAP